MADFHILSNSRTLSEPQWLVDTLPSSSYNGSIADVDVLVGSLEVLGISVSLGLAGMYVASVWFLYQSSSPAASPSSTPQSFVSRASWLTVLLLTVLDVLNCTEKIAKWTMRSLGVRFSSSSSTPSTKSSPLEQKSDVYGEVGYLQTSLASIATPEEKHGLRHLAVIMDGNRRYGKMLMKQPHDESTTSAPQPTTPTHKSNGKDLLRVMATSPLNGHRAGGEKLMEVIEHCITHHIEMLTVYAFSTENWGRSQEEIDVLMLLFEHFFQRIRECAAASGIFIRFISTEPAMLPPHILSLMKAVEEETRRITPRRIIVNVCVSYGGRSEIVRACQRISGAGAVLTEAALQKEMLRSITQDAHEEADASILEDFGGVEPHVLLRTSGEARTSNFLMYEAAYSELVFVDKAWPEIDESDIKSVIGEFTRRQRRFGK